MCVISLSRGSVPCEFATRLAVDAGITVVKVEVDGGDPLRSRPGHLFSYLAAGKQSVAIAEQDLRSTLALLLNQCDAVVADEWGRAMVADIARSTPLVVVGERDGTRESAVTECIHRCRRRP